MMYDSRSCKSCNTPLTGNTSGEVGHTLAKTVQAGLVALEIKSCGGNPSNRLWRIGLQHEYYKRCHSCTASPVRASCATQSCTYAQCCPAPLEGTSLTHDSTNTYAQCCPASPGRASQAHEHSVAINHASRAHVMHTRPTTQLHNSAQHRSGKQCRHMNTTIPMHTQHRSGEQVGHTKTATRRRTTNATTGATTITISTTSDVFSRASTACCASSLWNKSLIRRGIHPEILHLRKAV